MRWAQAVERPGIVWGYGMNPKIYFLKGTRNRFPLPVPSPRFMTASGTVWDASQEYTRLHRVFIHLSHIACRDEATGWWENNVTLLPPGLFLVLRNSLALCEGFRLVQQNVSRCILAYKKSG